MKTMDPDCQNAKCRPMILVRLVHRNTRYMQIFARVPRGGAYNDSGVVEERDFNRSLLTIICSEL